MRRLSASMRNARSTTKSPTCNQGREADVMGVEFRNAPKRIRLPTKDSTTAVMESCALRRGLRSVKSVMTAAESSGSSNTIHARFASAILQLHQGQIFDVRGLALPV